MQTTHSIQHNLHDPEVKSKVDAAICKVFQKYLPVLCDGISDPSWLATQLYSREIITRDTKREVELEALAVPVRTRKLLSAVEDQITSSPAPKFRDFASILRSKSSLEHLATNMEEAYSKLKFFMSLVLC